MAFKRLTSRPDPIMGDPCADPRVDCMPTSTASALPAAQVARNALKAAGRVAGALIGGQRVLVSDAERDRRLAICAACSHYAAQGNAGLGRCRLCGCTRKKASFATERCPDGRWGASKDLTP